MENNFFDAVMNVLREGVKKIWQRSGIGSGLGGFAGQYQLLAGRKTLSKIG